MKNAKGVLKGIYFKYIDEHQLQYGAISEIHHC